MPENDLRVGILELMRLTRAGEQALVEGLSPEERAATGTPEQWSAKDVIAHVTAWRLRQTDRLRAALEDTTPPTLGSDDEENADIFAEYSAWSWQAVEAEAERSVAALADLVQAFSDATLTDGQRFGWTGGRPLIHSLLGIGVEHPTLHVEAYYREHGQTDRGFQLHEGLVAAASDAHMPALVLGPRYYNLACAYALADKPSQWVLSALREALRLQPDLAQFARDDPDFATVRDAPDFQSLVGE